MNKSEVLKEEELLSTFENEEILEKIKTDKKWINKLKHSTTFAANIIKKLNRSNNKDYVNSAIDIIFDSNANLKKMNLLYSIAMNSSNEKLINKLLENKLNIYEKLNENYILFGFIPRKRFDLLDQILGNEISKNRLIRWDVNNTPGQELARKITESNFYNKNQIEILKKIKNDPYKQDKISLFSINSKIFRNIIKDSLIHFFKYENNKSSDFFDKMDEYFSYLLVKKEESLFLNDSEKNNLIKRICFEILIANNRFISNDISQSFVNFINSKENQFSFEDVIDEYMSVDKISLDGFLLINKVYDITDLMIDDIDRIKDINLKEKLLKFKLIKDEKKVLDSFIIKENEEEKIVIKRL